MKTFPLFTSAMGSLLCLVFPAHAAVEEGMLAITATVIAQCTITTTDVAFGQISPTQAASATGSIKISCDDATALDAVTLDGGANPDGSVRRMVFDSSHYIPYTLTVGASAVGAGDDIKTNFTSLGVAPFEQAVDVEGAIAAVAAPGRSVGTYSDAVTITVTYSTATAP